MNYTRRISGNLGDGILDACNDQHRMTPSGTCHLKLISSPVSSYRSPVAVGPGDHKQDRFSITRVLPFGGDSEDPLFLRFPPRSQAKNPIQK